MTAKKLVADIFMAIALLALMSYSLIGEELHELLGIFFAILFLVHQWNNLKWYQNLFKGRYSFARRLVTIVNLLLLFSIGMQMVSGILLSKYLLTFLEHDLNLTTIRLMHLAFPYWFFLLASLHIGFHSKMIISCLERKLGKKIVETESKLLLRLFSIYGAYALIDKKFLDYMFVREEYAYFDFNEALLLFFSDYLAVMVFGMTIGHLLMKLAQKEQVFTTRG